MAKAQYSNKKLIVNADDFGHTKSVSKGISEGFSKGIITSTSLMTNSEFAGHAADLAIKKDVDVGVHLNCVDLMPLSKPEKVSELVKQDGEFKSVLSIGRIAAFSSKARQQIYLEFDAQIKKAISLGIRPTHLDTHHWSSMFPAINEIVLKLARKYEINKARCAYERFNWPLFFGFKSVSLGQRGTQLLKFCLISSMSAFSRQQFKKYGVKTTNYYYGIMQTCASSPLEYFKNMINVVEQLRPGTTELMTHPGWNSKELEQRSWYTKHRELELKALMSPALEKLIKQKGIRLIGFKEL